MTHTEGPWVVMKGHPSLFNGCDVVVSMAIEDAIVCSIGHDIPGDTANARLIAAAPELLEALKGYQLEAESYHKAFGHGLPGSVAECDSICEQIEAGRAAIAKAEGR